MLRVTTVKPCSSAVAAISRAEVRAKTDLKIRMSDAPANPDRVWDAGLRDDDIVAVITCFDRDEGPEPADDAVCFTVGALRASVDRSKLGPPKSASEGAERDRTWPATVPTRDGTVLEVTDERLIVQMNADAERPARRQNCTLHGKSVYVSPGDTFRAQTTILAGEPPAFADLSAYLPRRYAPLDDLQSDADADRYAAVNPCACPARNDCGAVDGAFQVQPDRQSGAGGRVKARSGCGV